MSIDPSRRRAGAWRPGLTNFYLGDPVDMLHLMPDGSGRAVRLGNNLAAGRHPQLAVPKGVWERIVALTR